jgi:hypothetical protein
MSIGKLSPWVILLAVACNGKITIPGESGGAAGIAGDGVGGASAGMGGASAGGSPGGNAGKAPVDPSAGMAGEVDHEGGNGGTAGDDGRGVGGYISSGARGGSGPVGGSSGSIHSVPGTFGANCIPGGLVTEAEGSPAKAVIRTLDRCSDGLSCNAQGKCVPAPDCPQSRLCVMRRAALSENVGGAPGNLPGGGAGTGQGGDGNPLPPNTVEQIGVVALSASESYLHWLEYGTRNTLGTYQHDGTLMSYAIADGTTKTIASGLEGPTRLGLTTTHAYIYVDGGELIGTQIKPQLLRVPLAGGSVELVQDGTQFERFTAVGSQAFWGKGNQTYSMLPAADAVPSIFQGTLEYEWGVATGQWALHGDGVFRVEGVGSGALLSRAQKGSDEFERVRALGSGAPSGLRAVGDRYFLNVAQAGQWTGSGWVYNAQVLTAGFVGTDPPIRLLERTAQSTVSPLWAGTVDALYWSDGRAIYRQPLPNP